MLRKKEWYEKGRFEKVLSISGSIFYGVWFIISRTVLVIYRFILKLAKDVLTHVYGKFVALLGAILFAWIIAESTGIFHH